jgi:hypothetical protein
MVTYACYLSVAKSSIGLPLPLGSSLFWFGIPSRPLSSKSDELLIAPGAPQEIRILVNFIINHLKFFFEHCVDFWLI